MSLWNKMKMVAAWVTEKAARVIDWMKDKAHKIGNFVKTELRMLCGKFIKWVSKTIQKLKEKLNIVVYGTVYSLEKTADGFRRVSHNYTELPDDEWEKNTVVSQKVIPEEEVPIEFREKAARMIIGEMINISEDVNNVAEELNSLELVQ